MNILLRILLFTLIIVSIVVFDISLVPALSNESIFNLLLAASIYTLVIISRDLALIIYVSGSVLLALMGSSLIPITLMIGVFILLVMDWIFESFLTNRSYYTLLSLGLAGWFSYYLFFSLIIFFLSFIQPNTAVPTISWAWGAGVIIGSMILTIFLTTLYILTTFFSKKIKSYFILSS